MNLQEMTSRAEVAERKLEQCRNRFMALKINLQSLQKLMKGTDHHSKREAYEMVPSLIAEVQLYIDRIDK